MQSKLCVLFIKIEFECSINWFRKKSIIIPFVEGADEAGLILLVLPNCGAFRMWRRTPLHIQMRDPLLITERKVLEQIKKKKLEIKLDDWQVPFLGLDRCFIDDLLNIGRSCDNKLGYQRVIFLCFMRTVDPWFRQKDWRFLKPLLAKKKLKKSNSKNQGLMNKKIRILC